MIQELAKYSVEIVMNFIDKKITITDANYSIGRDVAFANQGADVAISYSVHAGNGSATP